jgi:phosphohistidine swiveling domain-containing protein
MKWLELAHEKKGHLNPTMFYSMSIQHIDKLFGINDGIVGNWYFDHEVSYISTSGGFSKVGRIILEKLRENRSLLNKIIRVNNEEIPLMLNAAGKLSGDLSNVSGGELLRRWTDWLNKFISLMTYSAMGTALEMEDPILTKELEKILVNKLGKSSSKTGKYFQILTTPTERTIAGQEEIDLLKLKIKQISRSLAEDDVKEHVRKYSWIAYGYDGPSWNFSDIKQRLEQLSSDEEEINFLIEEKENQDKINIRMQRKAEEELKLDKQEKYLFEILRVLGFWKFERKFRNQQAHEMMDDFIKEVAKRNNLSIAQVKMVLPNEMEDILVHGKFENDTLNQRIKESVVIFRGLDYEIISGNAVKKISKELKESFTVDENIKELNGSTAYPGNAKGIVRIVDLPEEMNKVSEGDILVSMSTSPQILPAMKRAGAIVTDSGGITCHAAIVAREIKVPTLIGTKIATKVFKDGDLVEVDANKGIVRKV